MTNPPHVRLDLQRSNRIGIGEAVITGLVVASVIALRPDLVYGARHALRTRELEIRSAQPEAAS